MSVKGRPKKKDALVNLWIVEQYYHGDALTQSWGAPIEVCKSEENAIAVLEESVNNYIKSLDGNGIDISNIEIDREIPKLITIRYDRNHFYPSMDFWYYNCYLVDSEED